MDELSKLAQQLPKSPGVRWLMSRPKPSRKRPEDRPTVAFSQLLRSQAAKAGGGVNPASLGYRFESKD